MKIAYLFPRLDNKSSITLFQDLIPQLKKFIRPDVPVVALQNGVGISVMLENELPNPIYRAIVPFNVIKNRAGQFHRATAGNIVWQQSLHAAVNYIISVFNHLQLPVQLLHIRFPGPETESIKPV